MGVKTDGSTYSRHVSTQASIASGEGAGGKIALKPVMLDRVTIGNMETANVEGVIVNSDMKVSLLGQSWLKRVATVEIKGDRMILK